MEISVRLLDGHRHSLSGNTSAQRGRLEPLARLQRVAMAHRRGQPLVSEDGLPAHPDGIQLQDGDIPALHHRRRRQLRRARPRFGHDIDGAGQRGILGHIPRIQTFRLDRSVPVGTPRAAHHRNAEPNGGRAVPATHQQLQAFPVVLHRREHGHRRHRIGHRRHRRMGRRVPRRLPHAHQEQPFPANSRRDGGSPP